MQPFASRGHPTPEILEVLEPGGASKSSRVGEEGGRLTHPLQVHSPRQIPTVRHPGLHSEEGAGKGVHQGQAARLLLPPPIPLSLPELDQLVQARVQDTGVLEVSQEDRLPSAAYRPGWLPDQSGCCCLLQRRDADRLRNRSPGQLGLIRGSEERG